MILEGIIATSRLDKHNMRFTKEALESGAKLINGDRCSAFTIEHDATVPPIGKVLKASVREEDDGEYLLVAQQEVFERESNLVLPDGAMAIRRESETDIRPIVTNIEQPDKFQLIYDPTNFSSSEIAEEFFQSIRAKTGENAFAERSRIRKSEIPDPEIVITLSKALLTYLAGKKLIEKIGDKIADKVTDDIAKFYDLVKSTTINMLKYAIPKNRPITYVFDAPGSPQIQFVAVTNDSKLLESAIKEEKLMEKLKYADELSSTLGATKIQFLLNHGGDWEFNYLLTNTGGVIGTPKSFGKQARRIEILGNKQLN